ncbi:MAG: hypothetical protein M0R21_10715 [Lentimicrobiaceae bacterium]|nr:hypothetical protein [Lentimicrobiaceae bacterium]
MNKLLFLFLTFSLCCYSQIEKNKEKLSNSLKNYDIKENETIIDNLKNLQIDSINDIPTSLIKFLSKKFPNYKLPTIEDYAEGWKPSADNKNLPFITSSDFNGDGYLDFSIFLLNPQSKELTLFVFLRINSGYKYFILGNYKNVKKIEMILSVEKKGKWDAAEETIDVLNDGILVENFIESESIAFYWDGEKFIKFLFE